MTEKDSKVVRVSNSVANRLQQLKKKPKERVSWNTLIERALSASEKKGWRK